MTDKLLVSLIVIAYLLLFITTVGAFSIDILFGLFMMWIDLSFTILVLNNLEKVLGAV